MWLFNFINRCNWIVFSVFFCLIRIDRIYNGAIAIDLFKNNKKISNLQIEHTFLLNAFVNNNIYVECMYVNVRTARTHILEWTAIEFEWFYWQFVVANTCEIVRRSNRLRLDNLSSFFCSISCLSKHYLYSLQWRVSRGVYEGLKTIIAQNLACLPYQISKN